MNSSRLLILAWVCSSWHTEFHFFNWACLAEGESAKQEFSFEPGIQLNRSRGKSAKINHQLHLCFCFHCLCISNTQTQAFTCPLRWKYFYLKNGAQFNLALTIQLRIDWKGWRALRLILCRCRSCCCCRNVVVVVVVRFDVATLSLRPLLFGGQRQQF